ncbi:hypothetical protein [Thermosyntropha sp.]|uniref:hypothetical protein n=1 Tax=Thermosyntropha sp. TaxID=2740820 RepID=UPI0025EF1A99|nr:hypothetical protein [Thermosyntropha sp.]MBO8159030.1 hypothetical protein [Thermosyntropha sp.]
MDESTLLRKIIENFKKQYLLYLKVWDLAREQERCLSLENKGADIDLFIKIMREREAIIREVSILNEENVKMRNHVTSMLGIESFSLSQLKDRTKPKVFDELSQIMTDMNRVLLEISEIDQKNMVFIKDMTGVRCKSPKASHEEAKKFYTQVMQQKKCIF